MNNKRHGLSIGIERTNNNFFLSIRAVGKLTHEDYEVMTPLIDAALGAVKEPHVIAFVDGTELKGWELRAAWDDFKLGLKHGNQFEKIAICGSETWLETAAKIGSWFILGETRYFEDEKKALAWLTA